MIFVNFKTYQEATGEQAFTLAKICQAVAEKTSLKIIPLVQTADIFQLSQAGFEVWAQHVDSIDYGSHSGQVLPEAVLAAGAKGTMLNHSEAAIPLKVIKSTVVQCRDLKLKTLVCAPSIKKAQAIEKLKPDLIAYEPPELIGSRTASVATAKPAVIKALAAEITTIPVLVGAGIHSQKDVKIALELGAQGILVASDVVLAQDPEKELFDLAQGF